MKNKPTQKSIPEGWKSVQIKDVAFINKKSLGNETRSDFSFKYIDLSAVDKGRIILPTQDIQYKHAPSRARRLAQKGDILMSTVRPNLLGHCIVDFVASEFICSTGFAVIENKRDLLNNRFLFAYLFSKKLQDQVSNLLVGSSYPAINSSHVADLKFYLPTLPEQDRIVSVLEIWDKGIEGLSKKIEAKKQVKRGLMQGLLFGKVRLPGFKDKWQTVELGEVLKERNERDIESKDLLLYSLTIENGVCPKSDRYNRSFLVKSDAKEYKKSYKDDIVYNPANLRYGAIARNKNNKPVLLSPIYQTLFVKDKSAYDIDFLDQYLTWDRQIRKMSAYAEGTLIERMEVKIDSFKMVQIDIPEYKEQKAISSVLLAADRDVESLEQKLKILQEQKRYLLNNLITGAIRTPETLSVPK